MTWLISTELSAVGITRDQTKPLREALFYRRNTLGTSFKERRGEN